MTFHRMTCGVASLLALPAAAEMTESVVTLSSGGQDFIGTLALPD